MDTGATTPILAETWPWIAIICLGLFHGINPAMGWLFAVALGLHRHSQRVVLASLIPIAVGHAVAVSTLVIAVVTLGVVVDTADFVAFGWRGASGICGLARSLWPQAAPANWNADQPYRPFSVVIFDSECPWRRPDAYSSVDAHLLKRLANKRISG